MSTLSCGEGLTALLACFLQTMYTTTSKRIIIPKTIPAAKPTVLSFLAFIWLNSVVDGIDGEAGGVEVLDMIL